MTAFPHDCKEELREVDLRATPARVAVLQLLEKTQKPLDVASIIEYLSAHNIDADQATVFRIINMFRDKGLARQIMLGEGKFRYELSPTEDHHHFICQQCGSIEDVSDCNISSLEKEIEKKKGLKVLQHSLEFFGICQNCQA